MKIKKEHSIEEIYEAIDNEVGYCTLCDDFTTSPVELDSKNCTCEQCREDSVFGARIALRWGFIC